VYTYFMKIVLLLCSTWLTHNMEQTPTPIVAEWIDLARDAQRHPFNVPTDVQDKIFAQIHPRQTIDEWKSDDAICVRELTISDYIYSFDIRDDTLTYFSKKHRWDNTYELHTVDLVTGDNCSYGNQSGTFHTERIPNIALCGNAVVFDDDQVRLMAYDFKNNKSEFLKWVLEPIVHRGFRCHTHLPLCASFNVNGVARVHDAETGQIISNLGFILTDAVRGCHFAWHPTHAILAVTGAGQLLVFDIPNKKVIERIDTTISREPHFLLSDDIAVFMYKGAICESGHRIDSGVKRTRKKEMPRTFVREMGDTMVLAELKSDYIQSEKTKCYLQPLSPDKKSILSNGEIPIHAFNTDATFYQLPRHNDYRFITLKASLPINDHTNTTTAITVFVPRSRVRLQHYCIMQAALAALKTNRSVDWALFKRPVFAPLIQETAERYAFFATVKKEHIDGAQN
jgi:hypothetical protein